jgi:hypothetical protein
MICFKRYVLAVASEKMDCFASARNDVGGARADVQFRGMAAKSWTSFTGMT